jgi:molybdopterin molybdotransferase
MISYTEARRIVGEIALRTQGGRAPAQEHVALGAALGRVLAERLEADRDAPPFDRSTRDGFAVRAADVASVPVTLALTGEIRAGAEFTGAMRPGECAQIMTGAAVPSGADAVVMIEHTEPATGGGAGAVVVQRSVAAGTNVVPRGSEAKAGAVVLPRGTRLGYAEISIAAQFGHAEVAVFARPRVAILSTGDEVVPLEATPGAFQIRNSNSYSLAAQVALAGGDAVVLGIAADERAGLRRKIEEGLAADALVLTGGVSMGKYDLVEGVLAELGAEFYFDAVAIRPGRPAVFGVCRGKPVLGLPGNPVSTMVTFELLGVPLVDALSGAPPRPLPLAKARARHAVRKKAALAHFLPAELSWENGEAQAAELAWQGSGDVAALARANCFLVVPETKLEFAAGDWVDVLLRRDRL